MTFQIELFAPSAQRVRSLAEAWTQSRCFASDYDARAWLGAMRCNLVSQLADDEPYFLAVVRDDRGAKRVLEVARAWPHPITDNGPTPRAPGAKRSPTRTRPRRSR